MEYGRTNPNNTVSIRFEHLRKEIQDVEKIRIIQAKLQAEQYFAKLQQLEEHIKNFSNKNINREFIPSLVKDAKKFLNSL